MGTHPIFESDFDCLTERMVFIYPKVEKSDFVEDFHGEKIADPFSPLEEPDAEITKKFVTEQNEVFQQYLSGTGDLKEKVKAKITETMNYEKFGCPKKYGDFYYYFYNPCLLYGYGGFNISLSPGFSTTRLAWMQNMNGLFALANIRGGGEYGEEWHQAACKLKKQNCFDDFQAGAEYLVQEGFTSADRLSILGGSNGGLLVGACANQRPDLFRAAVAAVGVMDMLRFQRYTVGHAWTSDFGSSDNKDEFEVLKKISPLHNIRNPEDGRFPSVLVTTADHDDRVVPHHSLKYLAQLQETVTSSKNPLLGRIDVNAGHGAGKSMAMVH